MTKIADALNAEQKEKIYRNAKAYPKTNGVATKVPGKTFERKPFDESRFPEHSRRLTFLCRNNAEFKRLLSLALIHLHRENETIPADAKAYVKFNFNKYSIKAEGLITEYSMKTKLFTTAMVTAIVAFNQYSQNTLANYVNNEFDKNPLTDEELEKANKICEVINVIPSSPVEEDEPTE